MLDAAGLLIPLVAGVAVGFAWRSRKRLDLNRLTLVAIVVLIFSMGFSIGSNDALLSSMPVIGAQALVLVILILVFSIVFVMGARRLVRLE